MDDLSIVQNSSSNNGDRSECAPMVQIPAWWSGFIFHILNPRQISMYLYLTMLADDRGLCHPTVEKIRKDLGLLSTTMVFESIAVLEEYGFFLRSRQTFPESRSRRNVYRRTACEYTILRLLESNKIDGYLHPVGVPDHVSDDARRLVDEGLQDILGKAYARWQSAADDRKRDVLIDILNSVLGSREAGIYFS